MGENLKYKNIVKGTFIERPNRFIAHVEIDNSIEIVHVKNTGRCKELLVPQATVYLQKSNNPHRKTRYDLIAVEKITEKPTQEQSILINIDSHAPNKVAAEWLVKQNTLFSSIQRIKPEYSLGKSRFDFLVEYKDDNNKLQKLLVEVKGCTLEIDGIALFPDAPTIRGVKHVRHLLELHKTGEYHTMILFIIQLSGVAHFSPNKKNDPEFAYALKEAKTAGVKLFAIDTIVTPSTITHNKNIPIILN